MNHRLKLFIPLTLLATAGCATVTADSDQEISVVTNPAGAHCTLTNGEGQWIIAQTPGTAKVKRAFSPLAIHCEKAGAGGADSIIEAQTRGRSYGNILLLGVPTVVDAATGDGYEYEHSDVTLTLK